MTTAATQPAATAQRSLDPDDVIVKCAGLTKLFKDFWMRPRVRAVDGINLEVRRGEVFGLLGPNGSGKSTTIKMILGLLHPTAGRISVFGKRPDDVATKKNIGYLPEESYLYRFLNARETLDYYGRLFHQNGEQRRRRIDMLLEMVGLEAVQNRPVGEFSKGMQRRIGLAQALINDPQLLILDEPTTGMDPIGTRQIKDLIIELARRGKTILLCSHLLSDVEDVCDRVSIMFGGKVRAEGTVDELLTQQSQTIIQTQTLDEQTIQQIDELLQQRGLHIEHVEHPRQRLEALFLDIVHKAQAEGVATSGARAGGKLAQFLVEEEARHAHMPESMQAAKVIEELMHPSPHPTQQAATEPVSTPAVPQAPATDAAVIEQLTQPKPPSSPVAASESDRAKKPQPDRSVIDSLIKKTDDQR